MGCLLFIQLHRSAASASHHWDKPHLRPLALCVSLEVEAEGRVGVPMVERVGLVASGVQFITRLAAVFAEEVDDFVVQKQGSCRPIGRKNLTEEFGFV